MSTPVGTNGRLPQGESWRRAMQEVARRRAEGATRPYLVRGRRIEPGWWAYEVTKVRAPVVVQDRKPMTYERVATLSRVFPRCVQRAKASHGGGTKVAWPSARLADEVAACLGDRAYRCLLPAPFGEHWHTYTSKKGKR